MKKFKKESTPSIYIFLLGRILFSAVFLVKSIEHFSPEVIGYAKGMGVPFSAVLVPASGILAFLGGLSVLLGYKAKIGAWLLVLFLLPVTFLIHRFWGGGELFAKTMHHYCFWKNLSLAGAALMITYFGSGPLGLDKK